MVVRFSLLLIALIAALTLAYYTLSTTSQPPQTTFTAPFVATNQNGQTVTQQAFLGKPTLYFFGFTHCPDICPTTLGKISGWLQQLGPQAANLNVVFITVDPARDTPAALKDYLQSFSPQITALTPSPTQLEKMAKEFMVYYAKVPLPEGDYTMNHSAMILMADAQGTYRGTISQADTDAAALVKLRTLIAN